MRYALVTLALMAQLCWADDITDAIDQAATFYNNGQTQQAINQLDFAAQMIRQLRGDELMDFLPEPLDEWTADDPTSASAGAAMFGGGTTVERTYQKGNKTVTARIITDSPMMQAMMMLFSNPIILASQGGGLQMIGGQQALVKPDGVTIIQNNTYLLQVNGDAQQADYVEYAGGYDFDGLQSF